MPTSMPMEPDPPGIKDRGSRARLPGEWRTQVEFETEERTRQIRRCRAVNQSHRHPTSSKGTHNPRCTHRGTLQIHVADSIEPWVWICRKHYHYFLREFGMITIRDSEDGEPRVIHSLKPFNKEDRYGSPPEHTQRPDPA